MEPSETIDEWADALEKWRSEYWALFRRTREAWQTRGEDDTRLRRLRKDLAAAEAAFATSDAAAQELQRQVDAHRAAGDAKGFRT